LKAEVYFYSTEEKEKRNFHWSLYSCSSWNSCTLGQVNLPRVTVK